MKKQFGFSSVIAVMVVSDNSSALRCSFSPVPAMSAARSFANSNPQD
jgi:hypothetical protein